MDLPDKSAPQPQPQVRQAKKAVIPPGTAKKVSRPASRRMLDHVFAESPRNILATVVANTLVPRLKAAGEEAFNSFLHGMLWPGGAQSPGSPIVRGTVIRGGGVVLNGGTDYNSMHNPAVITQQAAPTGPYQDLIFPSQQFAEAVYSSILSDLNQYRVVTVADLYEAAARTPDDSHSSYGWYGLDGARITKERDGFRLALPKPVRV